MSARSVRPWACFGLVAAAAALAYAPSFIVPFQFDDYARIIDNVPLQDGQWRVALYWLGSSRVLPSLTIIANYVSGGDHVLGYHIVNFALHLIAALGVFVLARLLCRGPRLRDSVAARRPLVVAGVAALVMACHPLQTQAVTYIIQRAAVMSALFYVWAVACYARGRLVQIGAAGKEFPVAHVQGVFARNRIVFEPRELAQKKEVMMVYHTTLDPAVSLEDVSAQLVSGDAGVTSVSWEPPKRPLSSTTPWLNSKNFWT